MNVDGTGPSSLFQDEAHQSCCLLYLASQLHHQATTHQERHLILAGGKHFFSAGLHGTGSCTATQPRERSDTSCSQCVVPVLACPRITLAVTIWGSA